MAEHLHPYSSVQLEQTAGVLQAGPGSNFLIQDGQFIQHNQASNVHSCYDADDGFKHLQAHVTTSAFDSDQQGDAPKCHPNTRKAVLNEIMSWIVQNVTRIHWILWLHGAAGAGKSAIARSIVDLCLAQNIPVARFFFFRTDPTRNNVKHVVATLAYQLIQSIPDLKTIIAPRIQSDPLIFSKSIETQFKYLIFEPLRLLQSESTVQRVFLLLFDGLDECDGDESQTKLIHIIANLVRIHDCSAIAFFGSREESHLNGAFRSGAVANLLLPLALDDHYIPDDDIRLLLDDGFADIKESHPFSHLLDPGWPAPALVEKIVNKSSGQFIYASSVMKFISSPRLHPAQQLEIVCGLRSSGNSIPFAQLDALYRHIFSQVQDIEHTTLILAFFVIGACRYVYTCASLLGITEADICISLADLTSIISCDKFVCDFLHASLRDFLLDRSRSQKYYIDPATWSAKLSIASLDRVMTPIRPSLQIDSFPNIVFFLRRAAGTPALRGSVVAFDPACLNTSAWDLDEYLNAVRELDFGDGGEAYQQQLNIIMRHIRKTSPTYLDDLRLNHNIADILAQIESEEAERMVKDPDVKASFGTRLTSQVL